MRAVDIIYAKRQGEALAPDAIRWLIREYTRDRLPDYQMAAWLMAVCFRGLDAGELAALTEAMMFSGQTFNWARLPGVKADKHSTGGVGDKVSLILAPLAAACGLVVPMVAGRGLGHTGGTLDKLEAIPGFRVDLPLARARRQLERIGVMIIGQSERFVPADKRLYALRDVTATVEAIPLLASSIMSKKLAEGCEVLVLDVKTGSGAFLRDRRAARELARTMTGIGRAMGRRVTALLTSMDQPTGRAIGNANETAEAIECLKGRWPADLKQLTYALTGRMLTEAGLDADASAAERRMERAIGSGEALEKFRRMIEMQGGDPRVVDEPRRLPGAPREAVIAAPRAGWLAALETRQIGVAAALLGAGRRTKEDTVDHGVGLLIHARLGDRLEPGQPLFVIRYRKESAWAAARPLLEGCFTIAEEKVNPPRLVLESL